jgi:hypothetical protein
MLTSLKHRGRDTQWLETCDGRQPEQETQVIASLPEQVTQTTARLPEQETQVLARLPKQ